MKTKCCTLLLSAPQCNRNRLFHFVPSRVAVPSDFSRPVHHKRVRNRMDTVSFWRAALQPDGVFDGCTLEKPVHSCMPLFNQAEQLNILSGVPALNFVEMRNALD